MNNRTCTGCEKVFTPTHGRQRCCSTECRKPNHATVTLVCDCCGGPAIKYRQTKRYNATYCGTLCRDFAKYGPTSCSIPKDHWALWFGRSSSWRFVEPKPKQVTYIANQCDDCGQNFVEVAHGTASTYCSTTCQRRVMKRNRRAREHQSVGSFKHSQIIGQYIRQGKACAYCKHPDLGLPDPEHVLPLSRGGRNDMSNLVAACRACNTDKGDLTLTEWAEDRERRGLRPVDTTLSSSEFAHLMHALPTTEAWRNRPSNMYSIVT